MQSVVPVHQSGKGVVVIYPVVSVCQVCLKKVLNRDIAVTQSCHTHGLTADAELDSLVFLRRKVGVEYIGISHTVHGGACHIAGSLK